MGSNKIESRLFLSSVESISHTKYRHNIYVGIGVCSRSKLSVAIPFDILSLILCAEHLRRVIDAEQVLYIIADTHALLTGHNPKQIFQYTTGLASVLDGIFKQWQIPHVSHIASQIHDIDYKRAKRADPDEKYMLAEIIDMHYFIKKHNVKYKLGWRYDKHSQSNTSLGFDEWYFDKQARKQGVPLEFYYTGPGYTMSESAFMVSPYICLSPKHRIIFKDNHLEEKLRFIEEEQVKCAALLYRSFLFEIQSLYCQLFARPFKGLKTFVMELNKQFS